MAKKNNQSPEDNQQGNQQEGNQQQGNQQQGNQQEGNQQGIQQAPKKETAKEPDAQQILECTTEAYTDATGTSMHKGTEEKAHQLLCIVGTKIVAHKVTGLKNWQHFFN